MEKDNAESCHLSQLTLLPIVVNLGSVTCEPLCNAELACVSLHLWSIQARLGFARLLMHMTHQELLICSRHQVWPTFCQSFKETLNWKWTCSGIQNAAAAAKSLQSCPTLCDPIDGSPPGSTVPGILQTRTREWVAISFSSAWKWKEKVKLLSHVWFLATPWSAAF